MTVHSISVSKMFEFFWIFRSQKEASMNSWPDMWSLTDWKSWDVTRQKQCSDLNVFSSIKSVDKIFVIHSLSALFPSLWADKRSWMTWFFPVLLTFKTKKQQLDITWNVSHICLSTMCYLLSPVENNMWKSTFCGSWRQVASRKSEEERKKKLLWCFRKNLLPYHFKCL